MNYPLLKIAALQLHCNSYAILEVGVSIIKIIESVLSGSLN